MAWYSSCLSFSSFSSSADTERRYDAFLTLIFCLYFSSYIMSILHVHVKDWCYDTNNFYLLFLDFSYRNKFTRPRNKRSHLPDYIHVQLYNVPVIDCSPLAIGLTQGPIRVIIHLLATQTQLLVSHTLLAKTGCGRAVIIHYLIIWLRPLTTENYHMRNVQS